MLQVARLAPRQLGDAAAVLQSFLEGELHPDGGATDRGGACDLYYTPFLLDGLIALQAELPAERVAPWLASFGDGAELDLVHLACLARSWVALGHEVPPGVRATVEGVLEHNRAADGGYARRPGARQGTLYDAFLVMGAAEDLGCAVPEPERLAGAIASCRAEQGGFADGPGLPYGATPTTAAAMVLLRRLGAPVPAGVTDWLLERVHGGGGFLAAPGVPFPDLLSTATALHALAGVQVPLGGLREPCLDFVDTLWTGRAFVGTWEDDTADCEYAFYALLALGHLSLC